MLVDPRTRQAFGYDAYARRYQRVRAAAIAGVKDESGRELVPACPSLAGFRDQDLRDTAVTWLARAGCTIPQVRAITGHDEASVYKILKHYLAIDREIAADAIGKLVVYLEQKGAAL